MISTEIVPNHFKMKFVNLMQMKTIKNRNNSEALFYDTLLKISLISVGILYNVDSSVLYFIPQWSILDNSRFPASS